MMKIDLTLKARDLIIDKIKEDNVKIVRICEAEELDPRSVHRFVSKKTERVTFETVARIMRFLCIPMEEIFGKVRPIIFNSSDALPKGI